MKQAFMVLTGGSFVFLMILGGLAFKEPKRFARWAILAMVCFMLGTVGLGVMENEQLKPGGWSKPGG